MRLRSPQVNETILMGGRGAKEDPTRSSTIRHLVALRQNMGSRPVVFSRFETSSAAAAHVITGVADCRRDISFVTGAGIPICRVMG